jgi:hypothetical protein
MPNGPSSSLTCLLRELPEGPEDTPYARSSTPSSTSFVVALLGVCCHMSSRLGRPSIITSEFGASMVPGEAACCLAPSSASAPQKRSSTQRGRSGFPVGEDHRGRRRERLRRRKEAKGRKCHLLVDTEGLVLKAKVHVANVADQEGLKSLLDGAKELFPRLKHLCNHHPERSPYELVAHTRTQRPFFRPKPIERIVRERVDSLTEMPSALCRYSCLCLSLANGRSSTSASSSFLAFSSSVGLLPGAFPGESERPWRTALR